MWFCKHRRAVTTLFLKSVCNTYILISLQPTMSLICILNKDEICHVRRAVTEKFNNYITMNYSKSVSYTHLDVYKRQFLKRLVCNGLITKVVKPLSRR